MSKNIDGINSYGYREGHFSATTGGDAIDIDFGYVCDGSGKMKISSLRTAAVTVQLEAGNSHYGPSGGQPGQKFYCQDAS